MPPSGSFSPYADDDHSCCDDLYADGCARNRAGSGGARACDTASAHSAAQSRSRDDKLRAHTDFTKRRKRSAIQPVRRGRQVARRYAGQIGRRAMPSSRRRSRDACADPKSAPRLDAGDPSTRQSGRRSELSAEMMGLRGLLLLDSHLAPSLYAAIRVALAEPGPADFGEVAQLVRARES